MKKGVISDGYSLIKINNNKSGWLSRLKRGELSAIVEAENHEVYTARYDITI